MKKILLISSLFASVTLLADSGILASRYCGGGTEYFELLESATNLDFAHDAGLESNRVMISDADDLTRYAGWKGADIGIDYQHTGSTQTKEIMRINADWTIKNKFIVRSECKDWNGKSNTKFIVRNGSTLTMENLVGNAVNTNSNFVSFYGENNTGVTARNKVILTLSSADLDATTVTSNNFGKSVLRLSNIDMEYTNSYMKINQLMMDGNTLLSLSSDMKIDYVYSNGKNNVIALNGNELNFTTGEIRAESTIAGELFIDYNNGAGTFIAKNFYSGNTSTFLYLNDFNYLEDLLIFSSASVNKSRIFFEYSDGRTYTGDDILVKDLGNNQYSYYVEVIPEPSTYAGIFGVIALGLALYRRRK